MSITDAHLVCLGLELIFCLTLVISDMLICSYQMYLKFGKYLMEEEPSHMWHLIT